MRMITLWQPWASLIFTGAKAHETRSRRYPSKLDGQEIVIHAAACAVKAVTISADLDALCIKHFGDDWRRSLPRAAALGTVRLVGLVRSEDALPSRDDRISGDWAPGRFGWKLADARLFSSPVACKGYQGWGEFSPPVA